MKRETCKRAIFQIFWKAYSCTISSFFEIETSNFGSSYVFSSPLKWQGRIWPNLTFWTQKRHISGKMQVHTIIPKSLFLEINEWNFGYIHGFLSWEKWEGQILPNLTFIIQKWHILGTIPGKIHVPLCQNLCFLS